MNAPIEEEIYFQQPTGFVDQTNPHLVCSLSKALYGLEQASRVCQQLLQKTLVIIGFTVSSGGPAFYCFKGERVIVLLIVYVDDIQIESESVNLLEQFIPKILEIFSVHAEAINKFLGMT